MMFGLASVALADYPAGQRTRARALVSGTPRAQAAFAEMDQAGFLRARAGTPPAGA